MDTEEPLPTVRDRIQSANVYLGAAPMVEALQQGAQVVITGRATDTGLTLAPLMHEFGWAADDWNRLAAGTIAGHIIECGAQCSGGNCQYDWRNIPDLADVGFPIVEVSSDGTFVVTKHEGTGGCVNVPSVKEQLVYEMCDPHQYITPRADLPEVQLRVGVRGQDRGAIERFTKEIAPLILTGPPGVTGFAGGRPKVEEIVAYWPALIPKSEIETSVEVLNA
jgi:hypothetical protein